MVIIRFRNDDKSTKKRATTNKSKKKRQGSSKREESKDSIINYGRFTIPYPERKIPLDIILRYNLLKKVDLDITREDLSSIRFPKRFKTKIDQEDLFELSRLLEELLITKYLKFRRDRYGKRRLYLLNNKIISDQLFWIKKMLRLYYIDPAFLNEEDRKRLEKKEIISVDLERKEFRKLVEIMITSGRGNPAAVLKDLIDNAYKELDEKKLKERINQFKKQLQEIEFDLKLKKFKEIESKERIDLEKEILE